MIMTIKLNTPKTISNKVPNHLVKKLTPLCSVLILSACVAETKDSYRAQNNILPENNIQEAFIEKGGLTGKVITKDYVKGALVCFDKNTNGFCDISEESENTYEGGKFSFAKATSDKYSKAVLIAQVNIAVKASDGKESSQRVVLSAIQVDNGSQMITPFTTLVVNEQFYNPYASGNKVGALRYLDEKLVTPKLLTRPLLEGEDYVKTKNTLGISGAEKLVKSYTQAFSKKQSDPFFAIANVVDEVVKTKSLAVNLSTLKSQSRLDKRLSLEDLNQKTTWDTLDKDETALGAGFAKDVNKVVTFSKWHNKLTLLDTSDADKAATVLANEKFLYVDGERYGVDAETGASAQDLTQIAVSNDASMLYSMLVKYEDESKKLGVGVYLSDISSSTIPATIFATVDSGDNFYAYENITDIALSSDGSKFGLSGDDKKIILFDAGSLRTPTSEITTAKKVKSLTFSKDNSLVFTGLYKKFNTGFGIYDISTKSLLGEFKLDEYPTTMVQKSEHEVFVASSEENKIYHLNIADKKAIKQLAVITTSAKVKKLSLSSDNKYLIAALTAKQVNAFDLNNIDKVATITVGGGDDVVVVDAFDVGANKIAVIYGTQLSYFNLTESTGGLSDAEKQTWEKEHRK